MKKYGKMNRRGKTGGRLRRGTSDRGSDADDFIALNRRGRFGDDPGKKGRNGAKNGRFFVSFRLLRDGRAWQNNVRSNARENAIIGDFF